VSNSKRRVLAIASGGGHWEQMMRLRATLDSYDTRYATTHRAVALQHGIEGAATLPDCNLDQPIKAFHCLLSAAWLILRVRPQVVISTGAAPGFFCLMWARLIGARTLWIDSIANAEQLSLSGRLAKRIAHQCLTQWEHLAEGDNPAFRGAVL
jgi:UDP-N-acetylglucosamine:LPS N-acetylglucosamine transferase